MIPIQPTIISTEDTNSRMNPSGVYLFYNFFKKHFNRKISIDFGTVIPLPFSIERCKESRIPDFELINTDSEFRVVKKTQNRSLSLTADHFASITDALILKITNYIKANLDLREEFNATYTTFDGIKIIETSFIISNEIIIVINLNSSSYLQLTIYSANSKESDFVGFIRFLDQFRIPDTTEKNNISIIKHNSNSGFGYFTRPIKDYSSEFSINHYNDDFRPISEKIITAINEGNNKGLVLLYGGVGTGKTSYIKHLITASTRRVFYIPPDLAHSLANPNFIEFMSSNMTDSLLVIEDAETVLKPRGAGETQAVSNILNMSDGILGDAISSMIICTFNEKIENIDQALLRPGRLVASYEFKELVAPKANQLLHKLYGDKYKTTEAMTLAEIFNQESMPVINAMKKQKVGFA